MYIYIYIYIYGYIYSNIPMYYGVIFYQKVIKTSDSLWVYIYICLYMFIHVYTCLYMFIHVYTTYKSGDAWGMVLWHCFTHISAI